MMNSMPVRELCEWSHMMHVNDNGERLAQVYNALVSPEGSRPAVVRSRSHHFSTFFSRGTGLQQSFSSFLGLCCTTEDCTTNKLC